MINVLLKLQSTIAMLQETAENMLNGFRETQLLQTDGRITGNFVLRDYVQ